MRLDEERAEIKIGKISRKARGEMRGKMGRRESAEII
jgi:hypothetical protein